MLKKTIRFLSYLIIILVLILGFGIGLILLINNSNTSYLSSKEFKESNEESVLIKNVNLVPMTSDTIIFDTSVLIKNGRIDKIGKALVSENAKIIEGNK